MKIPILIVLFSLLVLSEQWSWSTIEGSGDEQPSDGPEYLEFNPQRQNTEKNRILKAIEQMQKRFDKVDARIMEISTNVRQLLKRRQDSRKFQKIGHKSYLIENTHNATAMGARRQCEKYGAKLASVANQNEFNLLIAALSQRDYWLDIYRDDTNPNAFHSYGSAVFLSWLIDEPNNINNNEDCVELRKYQGIYGMNDDKCNVRYHFICEMN